MAVALREAEQCVDFFQQTLLRAVCQWQKSKAVQQVDVPVLDQNRLTILNIVNRGLEYHPTWPELKPLVILLASYMERRGHWDTWREILDKAIRIGNELGDFDGEITLTALFARLSQRQSRADDVIRYYRRVIQLAKRHRNQFEAARACSNLGYYYIGAGYWWRAEVLSCHALAIFEELGSEHGRAHTHNHLGLLYARQGRWSDAIANLELACKIWDASDDQYGLMHGHTNLGMVYIELKQSELALKFLTMAAGLAQSTGEYASVARIWNNLSSAHLIGENLSEAEKYAKKAEYLFRKHSDYQELAHVLHNLGLIFAGHGRKLQAATYFKESLHLYQRLKDDNGEKRVVQDMKRSQRLTVG